MAGVINIIQTGIASPPTLEFDPTNLIKAILLTIPHYAEDFFKINLDKLVNMRFGLIQTCLYINAARKFQ